MDSKIIHRVFAIFVAVVVLAVMIFGMAGCTDSPEHTAELIKEKQARMEREVRYNVMKETRKAIFTAEATYRDNCEVGEMHWIGNEGYEKSSKAVICDGLPTVSTQYQTGKIQTANLIVGESVEDPVIKAAKVKAEAKTKALSKLSDEDKKALDLK